MWPVSLWRLDRRQVRDRIVEDARAFGRLAGIERTARPSAEISGVSIGWLPVPTSTERSSSRVSASSTSWLAVTACPEAASCRAAPRIPGTVSGCGGTVIVSGGAGAGTASPGAAAAGAAAGADAAGGAG